MLTGVFLWRCVMEKLREEAELSLSALGKGRKLLEEAFAYDLWLMLHDAIKHKCLIGEGLEKIDSAYYKGDFHKEVSDVDEPFVSPDLLAVIHASCEADQLKYGEWAYLNPDLVEKLINTIRNMLEEFLILVDIRGLPFIRKALDMEEK